MNSAKTLARIRGEDGYERLRPAVSICLLNQTLFPAVEAYHLAFGLFAAAHEVCLTDHIQIHLLELPKFRMSLEELHSSLEKWLYFFQHAATMEVDGLPAAFGEPVYRRAAREFEMLTKDALERERYDSRQKALRDQMSLLQEAQEQGRDEGWQEGRQEGRREGEFIGRIRLCEQRLKRSLTPQDELVRLSLDELSRRADQLEAELFGS